ncbi:hypothetical protein EWM64_g8481 [Hericium alpestre]|uniref:Uncharacterized protein n=1 Tax=Hericium alpestre TaxID=135208 RepID=A0A4Y9ZNW8_9AGAM|nr:hypothetical protein EWM64_g8481 [Hericium alpestre]
MVLDLRSTTIQFDNFCNDDASSIATSYLTINLGSSEHCAVNTADALEVDEHEVEISALIEMETV